MHRDLYYIYIWSYETYRGWYKYIKNDVSDEAIGIEAEVEVDVEVDVGGWGTQWPKNLIAPDRELELDK